MIGFKARKNECEQWEFSIPYKSVIDIKCAFLSNMKARYVLLGLYTALTPDIPPVVACIIPHDNKFTLDDLREWMQLHIDYWKQEGLPVIQVGCDYDTKNLNYIEYIGLSGNGYGMQPWN